MGDPALKLTPDDVDLSPPLDPPLSTDEKARLLEGLAAANVSEAFRESLRRDLESA
jgi:hypothetical protein